MAFAILGIFIGCAGIGFDETTGFRVWYIEIIKPPPPITIDGLAIDLERDASVGDGLSKEVVGINCHWDGITDNGKVSGCRNLDFILWLDIFLDFELLAMRLTIDYQLNIVCAQRWLVPQRKATIDRAHAVSGDFDGADSNIA